MKAVKIILGVLLVLVLVVAGLGYYIFSNLNQIVKDVIEDQAPKVLLTDVNLNEVDLDILNGRGELKGLVISNPEGFKSNSSFEMGNIALELDPASLQENPDVIYVKELVIDGALLTAEQKGKTTNLQTILDNIEKSTGAGQSSGDSSTESDSSSGPQKNIAIGNFKFINSKVNVITEYGDKTLDLPAVEFANIGDKNKGLPPNELLGAILKPLIDQAKKSAEKALRDKAKDEAEAKLKEKLDEKLNDKQKDQLDKLKDLF